MNKKFGYLLVLILSFTLLLAACGDKDKNDGDKNANKDNGNNEEVDNNGNNDNGNNNGNNNDENEGAAGEPQDGGTLVYALDSEPDGVFNINFYGTATDAEVIGFFDDNLIKYDEHLKPIPNVADWETEDDKVYTFTFQEGVKWHNGEELTVDDWVFALETLADPDYPGRRYTNVQNIEGAKEYKAGEADEISGLNVISDYEIEITFDKARVNNLENLWTYPMSRKEFEGVEVADMEDSEQVRSNPVGIGPFKVTKIIPGEAIQYEAFEDYWQGKPHLDGIVLKIIDPSLVVGELKQGQLDMTEFHPSNYEEIEGLENAEVLRAPGLSYYYIGFHLGNWDGETSVMDKEKYHNQDLRLAMAHAIDREAWIEEYFYGLGSPLNRVVPTSHWIAADDADLENHFEYDPELAKQILDDAGYVDTNDDGFREDPDGEELIVKFSHYATNNPDFETRAKAITQYWEDIGLKTELEMIDSGLYYEAFEEVNPSVDYETFFGGWSTGADPDPTGLWASDALWNFPRWVDEKNDQLLQDALDIEIVGIDEEEQVKNRQDIYTEWQQNINEVIPMIPIAELEEVLAISSRLKGVEMDVSGRNSAHEWWVEE